MRSPGQRGSEAERDFIWHVVGQGVPSLSALKRTGNEERFRAVTSRNRWGGGLNAETRLWCGFRLVSYGGGGI
jgi:hypothetical protein